MSQTKQSERGLVLKLRQRLGPTASRSPHKRPPAKKTLSRYWKTWAIGKTKNRNSSGAVYRPSQEQEPQTKV